MAHPERFISHAFIKDHPLDAARILETFASEDTVAFLGETPSWLSAEVLKVMDLNVAERCLELLDTDTCGAILEALPLDVGAVLMRRLNPERAGVVLAALDQQVAAYLRILLAYPEGTAGALMDPRVFTLPEDVTVEEALARIRRHPEHVMYYLYILNAERALVGVVNVRELLLASTRARVSSAMQVNLARLSVGADRPTILAHPGWLRVHALPVVDDSGRFAGVIRYRTLRRLESVDQAGPAGQATGAALGELFRLGLAGLVKGTVSPGKERV